MAYRYHNPRLYAVLSTHPRPRSSDRLVRPPPVGRLARWLLAFWHQPSLPLSIEVIAVVLLVAVFGPPAPRWNPLPAPPERALVRTDRGEVWALPTASGHRDPIRLSNPNGATSRELMQDPVTDEIVSLDGASGLIQAHLATALVQQLLPGPRDGRFYGLGAHGTDLFELDPESLSGRAILMSDQTIGDVAAAGSEFYLSLPESDRVLRLRRTQRVSAVVAVEGGPSALWMKGDGSQLWVMCQKSHEVKVVDLTGPPQVRLVVPGPDDEVVGIVSGDDHVYLIGRHTLTTLDNWSPDQSETVECAGHDPVGWAFSASSHALLVATRTPPLVEVVSTTHPRDIDTIPLSSPPTCLWLP